MARSLLISVALFAIAVAGALGQIPRTISTQGVLTDSLGHPVPNNEYQLVFRLYEVAWGGSQIWQETRTVVVESGAFSVVLGTLVPLSLPFDRQYWLGITVGGGGSELQPRIQLASSPYSLNAKTVMDSAITTSKIAGKAVTAAKIDTGQVVKNLNGLKDNITLAPGSNVSIVRSRDSLIISSSGGGGGLTLPYNGSISFPGANAFQVTNSGSAGIAINGVSTDPTSSGVGVFGQSSGSQGKGVHGRAASGTGPNYGVLGETLSPSGAGVFGTSPYAGVYGFGSVASSGTSYGVLGQSVAAKGRGVYGIATAATDTSFGVYGESMSSTGSGVFGINRALSGVGVSAWGIGTGGIGLSASGSFKGIVATGTDAAVEGQCGGYGYIGRLGTQTAGVRGEAPYGGYGVYGNTSGTGVFSAGVYGEAAPNGNAVMGRATGSNGIAIHGIEESGGWGGYFMGKVYVGGLLGIALPYPRYGVELGNVSDSIGRGRANAWVTYSSLRWKENVAPIQNPLETLKRLRGVEFDWKKENGGKHDVGLIGEEVAKIVPCIVDMETDGVHSKGLDYGRLVPFLLEAIKEQQTMIEDLKIKLTNLESRLGG